MLAFLIFLSAGVHPAISNASFQLVKGATAQSVDLSTDQPINQTQTFSSSDATAYSWLHLANVQPPSHTVTWDWIGPNNKHYYSTSYTIPDPGQGKTYQDYYLWSYIDITGHQPATMQGLWEIDVYIDGASYQTQYFTIASSAVMIQPTEGYSWPNASIPVYVQPNPSYAATDVEKAMLQWNFSQAWFQKNYGLGFAPTFSLVLSNNPASPIKVSFNQTQSGPNWGWTNYHYNYDGTGRFTIANCSVSIILSLSNGNLLNDVALQDVAEHELGHCLGLWHTAEAPDLMNHFSGSFTTLRYPSTLNLYALYELAGAHQVSQVAGYYALPNGIGYAFSPGQTNSSTTTTSTTTVSQSTTSSSASSTTTLVTSTNTLVTSNSSTSIPGNTTTSEITSQSTSIPEFPYQLVSATILTIVVVASYLFIKRQKSAYSSTTLRPNERMRYSRRRRNESFELQDSSLCS